MNANINPAAYPTSLLELQAAMAAGTMPGITPQPRPAPAPC